MAIFVKKTPTIQTIFDRDKDGNYTKGALLLQDILTYPIGEMELTGDYTFKLWNLTKWLISNNKEMVNDYKNSSISHMTITNKVQARIKRVRKNISLLSEFRTN